RASAKAAGVRSQPQRIVLVLPAVLAGQETRLQPSKSRLRPLPNQSPRWPLAIGVPAAAGDRSDQSALTGPAGARHSPEPASLPSALVLERRADSQGNSRGELRTRSVHPRSAICRRNRPVVRKLSFS